MIVVATPDELKLVRGNNDDVIICTGVGALNVIDSLRHIARNTPIYSVGYAGGNNIPVGTRCRIGDVKLYHPNAQFDDKTFHLDGDTPCFTSADFVTETTIKKPCVFDMELAFILSLGFINVTAEKVVSDNLSREGYKQYTGVEV